MNKDKYNFIDKILFRGERNKIIRLSHMPFARSVDGGEEFIEARPLSRIKNQDQFGI
ncbi:MAG: hypothetical protein IPJ74_12295 [Saprospiraceae bacterium]|nr:hypothetical protein [Saprospiraceae bacterium]